MQTVIDYIEANLTHRLDLAMVSDAAHYSKYHLHRQFSHSLGMTVQVYTQRRQLTEAAKLLASTQTPILDVALASGYASQQSFHLAFSSMYKQTPGQFRSAGRFYPLQLPYDLSPHQPNLNEGDAWEIAFATEEDIPCWMSLVRLTIDGFPYLDETEHLRQLWQSIHAKQALIIKDGDTAIGALGFSRTTTSIDFLGVHPYYRRSGVPRALLDKAIGLLPSEISITTYRAGDKADTGQRQQIIDLGFTEAELLTQYGYPTQRFTLRGDDA